jgi:hypothetical protein
MSDFRIKRGDLIPRLEVIFTDGSGNPLPGGIPAGATIEFHMRLPDSIVLKVNAAGVIDDGPGAQAAYNWVAGDTDTEADYLGEFEMTETNGKVTTFPNSRNLVISVFADLA